MKANEFVRNKGLKAAKLIIDCWIDYPETDVYIPDMIEYTFIAIEPTENCPFVSLSDLKRLVEAHELVDKVGGMDKAKILLRMRIAAELYESADEIEKAILDVESCQ